MYTFTGADRELAVRVRSLYVCVKSSALLLSVELLSSWILICCNPDTLDSVLLCYCSVGAFLVLFVREVVYNFKLDTVGFYLPFKNLEGIIFIPSDIRIYIMIICVLLCWLLVSICAPL